MLELEFEFDARCFFCFFAHSGCAAKEKPVMRPNLKARDYKVSSVRAHFGLDFVRFGLDFYL